MRGAIHGTEPCMGKGRGQGGQLDRRQEWIEVRTGSRCCQDRIGCQALGPKAPGGSSPVGVDFLWEFHTGVTVGGAVYRGTGKNIGEQGGSETG